MTNTNTPAKELSLLEKIVAYIKGDDAAITASKIINRAKTVLHLQIEAKKSVLLEMGDELVSAEEKLTIARMNGGLEITKDNKKAYLSNLVSAIDELDSLTDDYDNIGKEIAVLQREYDLLK